MIKTCIYPRTEFAADNSVHVSSKGAKITQEYDELAPMRPAALIALVFLSAEQYALGNLRKLDLRRFVCGSIQAASFSESPVLPAQPSTQSPLAPFHLQATTHRLFLSLYSYSAPHTHSKILLLHDFTTISAFSIKITISGKSSPVSISIEVSFLVPSLNLATRF